MVGVGDYGVLRWFACLEECDSEPFCFALGGGVYAAKKDLLIAFEHVHSNVIMPVASMGDVNPVYAHVARPALCGFVKSHEVSLRQCRYF